MMVSWWGLMCRGNGLQLVRRGLSMGPSALALSLEEELRKSIISQSLRSAGDPTRPGIIQRRPTTPSNRHTALIDRSLLFKGRPVPFLTTGLVKSGGRNSRGVITVRHRGGGHKRLYRFIDFKRGQHLDREGRVKRIEYDPNRSGFIALIQHDPLVGDDGRMLDKKMDRYSYILCPQGINIGSRVVASREVAVDVKPGNAMTLRNMPIGTVVHNIEMSPGRGGQLCRSAGTSAQLLEKNEERKLALLRLTSKEIRYVSWNCLATVGSVSNPEHKNESLGKAGRNRWKGRRPHVRGVAMNPVDHPHGGGEGKSSGGRPSCSPWGQLAKGFRTVRRNKCSPLIVRRRYE
uniref:Large ribosomal subunit protein uL2m n=1 Tax=Compsopogon caeruleus TaxID=31354 RepID=A0A7S1T562_9RHOD|mmetsp:Transcript_10125/g.20465  ORF Transcript_10125/g.20465 Transcript_10125/m.20465 type:complete len:347 (+) Transcript_10125:55-1095(+)